MICDTTRMLTDATAREVRSINEAVNLHKAPVPQRIITTSRYGQRCQGSTYQLCPEPNVFQLAGFGKALLFMF